MKKVLILVAALFVGLQAQAQLQVEGGYQHFFEHSHNNAVVATPTNWDGFFAGVRYNINLPVEGLSVVPGANLSTMFATNRNAEVALNIPVHVAYTYAFSRNIKLRGLAGPSFQIGLWNKQVTRSEYVTSFIDNYGTRSRFNFSLGLGAGVIVAERVPITLYYDFGLVNLLNSAYPGNGSLHRQALSLSVGYIF